MEVRYWDLLDQENVQIDEARERFYRHVDKEEEITQLKADLQARKLEKARDGFLRI